MKTVIVLGSGNSGAGAIHDYLLSRNDFQSPFKGKEFRLVNDPNGLDELYNNLYKNFSINGSANKIEEFFNFIRNSYYSKYNVKNNIYNKNIINLTKKFIYEISEIKYNGSPQFYFDKLPKIKKLIFYFKRFILNKNAKDIKMLNMTIPCSEELFLKYSEQYLKDIFYSNSNFNKDKNMVIEQGGNFLKPYSSTKYYGKERKIIFVSRNPKAIFWSMKRRNSLSYPGNNIKIFVRWYKKIMKNIDQNELNQIIHVNFENFFSNYSIEKTKLCNQLEISSDIPDNFDLDYTIKNLFKYKDHLTKDEILFIDKELEDYI